MAKFKVAVEWSMCGTVEVEADNVDNAIYIVDYCYRHKVEPLKAPPKDGEYIGDSFSVNVDQTRDFARD